MIELSLNCTVCPELTISWARLLLGVLIGWRQISAAVCVHQVVHHIAQLMPRSWCRVGSAHCGIFYVPDE